MRKIEYTNGYTVRCITSIFWSRFQIRTTDFHSSGRPNPDIFLILIDWRYITEKNVSEGLTNKTCLSISKKDEKGTFGKSYSATGNRTPVSRVTGGDTHHYTIVELLTLPCICNYKIRDWHLPVTKKNRA